MGGENNAGLNNVVRQSVTFKSPAKLLPPHIQRAHQMRAERAKKKASHEPVSRPEVAVSSTSSAKELAQRYISNDKRRETMSGTSERERIAFLKERLQEAVSREQYGEAAKLKQELNQNLRIAEVKAAANEEKRVLLSSKPGNETFQEEIDKLKLSHEESMRELRQDLDDAKKRDRTHVEVMGNCMHRIKTMEGELTELRAQNARLLTCGADCDIEALKQQMQVLQTENTRLKRKEEEFLASAQQVSKLQDELIAARDEIDHLKNSSVLSREEVQRLTAELTNARAQISRLQEGSDQDIGASQECPTVIKSARARPRSKDTTPRRFSKEPKRKQSFTNKIKQSFASKSKQSPPEIPMNESTILAAKETPCPGSNKSAPKAADPPAFAKKRERLSACAHCGRTFRASVLTRHVKVCMRAPGKKQTKTFDSSAVRAKALAEENDVDIKVVKRLAKRATTAPPKAKVSNWRQKSADLREAMLWARGIDPSTVKKPVQQKQAPSSRPKKVPSSRPKKVPNSRPKKVPNVQQKQAPNVRPKKVPTVQQKKVTRRNLKSQSVTRGIARRHNDIRRRSTDNQALTTQTVNFGSQSSHARPRVSRRMRARQMPVQVRSSQQEW